MARLGKPALVLPLALRCSWFLLVHRVDRFGRLEPSWAGKPARVYLGTVMKPEGEKGRPVRPLQAAMDSTARPKRSSPLQDGLWI